uniref:FCP1 homology domain-containing protein n=1 Tax=Amphora coffeiformis TaxID=265554 RepID=A0A7S3L811_9STRA|mmetsp:Transcript_9780/g.18726  ORF Transcript_9780/g.18726 Transcript_9780/m.18726 type:complete len:335 (-) Transcript_9780:101-1105(-)|eukprot:scaffold244_cov172-Amphora_coffeaeformis.AAC.14
MRAALPNSSTRRFALWVRQSGPEAIRVAFKSTLAQQNRAQSSIAAIPQQASTSSYGSYRSSNGRYRPQANGKAIPFHITDLYKNQSAAAAHQEYEEDLYEATTTPAAADVAKEYESDLIVVLDMDECLIHSQFLSSPQTAQVYAHQLQQQRRQSKSSGSKVVDHFKLTLPEGDLVHVNIRPGLHEFLDQCTERFETHIFTAASSIYAKPLLDNLDPEGTKFAGRWYREHCAFVEKPQRAYVKDLGNLPFSDLSRVVLVDNNPLSFLTNPDNGILVSSFYNDPNDTSLGTVWKLLQKLDAHKDDVRPILTEKFGLEEALQKMAAQKIAEKNRLAW